MDGTSRLSRLLGYLESDPENVALIADAANAALEADELGHAAALLERHKALAPFPPGVMNTAGIVAMRRGEREFARSMFEGLRAEGLDHPSVRFNLAWLNALDGRFAEVPDLLDDEVIATVPRAASLKVQALHHTAEPEDALALGQKLLERLPEDDALLGAASVAAMDADDYELAKSLASRAKGGSDALTTQGLVALNEDNLDGAIQLFERALVEHPEAPRAWLGRGLGLLAKGDADAAVPALERGASIFGTHLGSWIAAGWAQFLRGDLVSARRNFETALAADDNFGESHGALAVLDIAIGDLDSAKRRTEIALRLDKECFGGMLARVLLLEAEGKLELAQRIVERAMQIPIGVEGKTLAQAMVGIGMANQGARALQ